MWKVCENFVELLGGLCGVWKEKVRLTHKINEVRYLLYDEAVCSVDEILRGQFVSFYTIQGWSRISYIILFSVSHTLSYYDCLEVYLMRGGGGGARIFIYKLIFNSAIVHC
jgi:hypothetical protein